MGAIEVAVTEGTEPTLQQYAVAGGAAFMKSVAANGPATVLVTTENAALSTSTPLGSAGVYTSGFVTNEGGRRLTGSVFADQAGSLQVSGSDDGVHWNNVGAAIAVTASTVADFDVVLSNALTRIVYTNGGSAQATFRLNAYVSPYAG